MFGPDDDYDDFQYTNMNSMFARTTIQRITPDEFLEAAKSGDENVVKQYIAANQDTYDMKRDCKKMDVSNFGGNTALHLAAKHGHVNIVNLLLQTNIDRNEMGSNGNSALHYAVSESHFDVVQALLADERVITSPLNEDMLTPLDIAIRFGGYQIAKALFETGTFTSQYEYLLQIIESEIAFSGRAIERLSAEEKRIFQLFLSSSLELRDLLVLHKERFDFRKELTGAGVKLSKDAIKQIHTMSAEEFSGLKEMTEVVKNSGEFNPEAVSAAFSTPRLG